MSVALAILLGLLILVLLGVVFLKADAARVASAMRLAGPIVLGVLGGILLLLGRAAIGGMLISGAFAWWMSSRRQFAARKSPGKRSTVRTAALEMELDHDSGSLEGIVLAGRHESKMLSAMSLAELEELYADLAADRESRQLLETYLDGRFPTWREHANTNYGRGHGTPPGSGPMTKEEAYKILGLEAGATAADIRKAHRRLMQRVHPDLGGSSFLAARINEAKDVLLSNHD